jgi:hypothetical protein
MATPIREACLDEEGQPNETAALVQAALDAKGCLCVNRPGGRCKAPIHYNAPAGYIVCSANRRHAREPCSPPYAKVVFGVLNTILAEEEEQRVAKERLETRERAKRKAAEEVEILGTEPDNVCDRPDGPAPEGKTWSYSRGEWLDENFLRDAKRSSN